MSQGKDHTGNLFAPAQRGWSWWTQFRIQAKQVVTGGREGGFFMMVGKRAEALKLIDERQSRTAGRVGASAGEK
jgi:hypothetical protein